MLFSRRGFLIRRAEKEIPKAEKQILSQMQRHRAFETRRCVSLFLLKNKANLRKQQHNRIPNQVRRKDTVLHSKPGGFAFLLIMTMDHRNLCEHQKEGRVIMMHTNIHKPAGRSLFFILLLALCVSVLLPCAANAGYMVDFH